MSFLPTLLGRKQPQPGSLHWEFASHGGQQAVRSGNWKAVSQQLAQGRMETRLYDLAADPGEKVNVAAQHPDLVRQLESIFQQRHTPSELFPLPGIDRPARRPR